jgi:hypothetical protein
MLIKTISVVVETMNAQTYVQLEQLVFKLSLLPAQVVRCVNQIKFTTKPERTNAVARITHAKQYDEK